MFLGCYWRNTKECLLKKDFAFGVLVFGIFNLILSRRSQYWVGMSLAIEALMILCLLLLSWLLLSSFLFCLFPPLSPSFFGFLFEFSCYFKTLAQKFGKLVDVWRWILHTARNDTDQWGLVFSTMQITVNVHWTCQSVLVLLKGVFRYYNGLLYWCFFSYSSHRVLLFISRSLA